MLRRIVNLREQRRDQRHDAADQKADRHGKDDELAVGVHGFVHLARAEQLADDDADGVAHREEGDVKDVGDGRGDVAGRDHVVAAQGVALRQQRHARGPESLVEHQRQGLFADLKDKMLRNAQRAVHPAEEGAAPLAEVGKDDHDCRLHEA